MWSIIVGCFTRGYQLYGPYDSQERAQQIADKMLDSQNTEVVSMSELPGETIEFSLDDIDVEEEFKDEIELTS